MKSITLHPDIPFTDGVFVSGYGPVLLANDGRIYGEKAELNFSAKIPVEFSLLCQVGKNKICVVEGNYQGDGLHDTKKDVHSFELPKLIFTLIKILNLIFLWGLEIA